MESENKAARKNTGNKYCCEIVNVELQLKQLNGLNRLDEPNKRNKQDRPYGVTAPYTNCSAQTYSTGQAR